MPATARLFTALLPPEPVLASLRQELDRHPGDRGGRRVRWTTMAQWHVTLGFYGTDDPVAREDWLRPRLAGLAAPTLWLEGAGTFRGVLWTGVLGEGLRDVAEAARPDHEERAFHGHLTLARGPAQGVLGRWRRALTGYRSPEWTATEVVLMRSDSGGPGQGPRYTVVERFPLGAPSVRTRT